MPHGRCICLNNLSNSEERLKILSKSQNVTLPKSMDITDLWSFKNISVTITVLHVISLIYISQRAENSVTIKINKLFTQSNKFLKNKNI